jgi:DNA-binding Lrp family transcriptional regulator
VAAGWPALWSKRPPPTRSHLSGQRVAGGRTPRRAARMLSAYVLILTEVGKVAHVAQALSDLDGVQVAEDITGPYDIIARIQAPGLDQLGRLVVSRIQVVDGVTRTLTCTVLHR